ncbi:MAG: hypothetical protein JST59_00300 [Actinobacteria bacterium]|nr:hypothetical protein [Actinomycetota bacterium]
MHTILLRYEQLELRKLEMYRLAVRIDNEEREYRVRLGKGTSMESLRLSTAKLVECLTSEER